MAGRIPREAIQDVLSRVDLVELVGARVPLKRSGANAIGLCPFHGEKTPSFNVSRVKQFYHCFGCGAHGNAIDFLMAFERLSFVEAVEALADSVGMRLPREGAHPADQAKVARARSLYAVQEEVARFYQAQLRAHPAAGKAIAYLKRRGITGELAGRFGLGYAPPDWRNLPESLPASQLEAAGLVISRDGRRYDRFRDRIMFPIRDRRGRVVGFGGRVLGEDTPKYLNSPETEVFKKHREVYGLHEMLREVAQPPRIIVVEGYLDVIALAQHGIACSVATLGTATSSEHIELLFRHTQELVACFDGDTAGRNAAWKALEASLPSLRDGRSLKFLILPQGHDPDSLIREEGAQRFEERVQEAKPFSRYFFGELTTRLGFATIATLEQRAALAEHARPFIEKLPRGEFRDGMEEELGNLAGRRPTRTPSPPAPSAEARMPARSAADGMAGIWRGLLSALLHRPDYVGLISEATRKRLSRDRIRGDFVKRLMTLLETTPSPNLGGIIEHFRETAYESWIARLLETGQTPLPEAETFESLERWRSIAECSEDKFGAILERLDREIQRERKEELIAELARRDLSQDEKEELRTLMTQ